MHTSLRKIENKISEFIQTHEAAWFVVCGLQTVPHEDLAIILRLLREKGLYELEAMMIWRMENELLEQVD